MLGIEKLSKLWVVFSLWFSFFCIAMTQEEVNEIVEKTALYSYNEIKQKNLWSYPKPADNLELRNLHKSMGHLPLVGQWQVFMDLDTGRGEFEVRFVKNLDQSLTDALDDLMNHESSVDCMVVANFVALRCLQALLGNDQINLLCKSWEKKYGRSYELTGLFHTPLIQLFIEVHRCSVYNWKGRGGFGAIYNDPDYDKIIEKFTYNRLLNVFQTGTNGNKETLLMGFDAEFFNSPVICEEAKNHLELMFQKDNTNHTINWNYYRFLSANNNDQCNTFTINCLLINQYQQDQNYSAAVTRNPYYLNHPKLEICASNKEKGWALVNWKIK